MTTVPFDLRRHGWALAMLAALAAMFAFLLHRNLGLNPAIFADEWYYSKMSRLMPLSEAIVPSYLYLWLFKSSNACGDGFLDCVRVLNVVLFLGAVPFVYLVARQVSGKPLALLLALLSMLAPVNVYTAYFMPEAMYYFGFCVLSWVALCGRRWRWWRYALAGGGVLGLMSLVKVHAVFLLPALCVFTLLVCWSRDQAAGWLRIGLLSVALNVLAMFAVRFVLGYALGGAAAFHLFGSFYAVTADSTAHRSLFGLLPWAFINARGHLMALVLLLALPLATLALALFGGIGRVRAGAPLALLQLFALLMLGAALGMTIAYTASIAGVGRYEVLRLHLRYYSFVFPLLLVIGAASIGTAPAAPRAHPKLAWTIALLLAAVLLVALVKLPAYSLNPIDGPEISALPLDQLYGRILVGIDLLILLLWARNSRYAAPLFVFAALPLILYCGNDGTTRYLAQLIPSWEADRAGKFAHRYVPRAEHRQITVAGTDIQNLMRAQFHIDDKDVALLELPKDAAIDSYQLPAHNKWLLVVGKHALPAGIVPVVATADYALVALNQGVHSLGTIRLSDDPIGNALVSRIDGLSHAESWGRWSDGKQVVIHFRQPLPKQFQVILKAQSYDVNATLPFTAQAGANASAQQFRLSATPQEIGLLFDTDGSARTLTITIPRPISPAELGQPADPRTLGIGISELEIGTRAAPAP